MLRDSDVGPRPVLRKVAIGTENAIDVAGSLRQGRRVNRPAPTQHDLEDRPERVESQSECLPLILSISFNEEPVKSPMCLTYFELIGWCLKHFERMIPVWEGLPVTEGKINMAARRQVTNKLRDAYRTDSEADRGRILDRVVQTTGMGRSTARRMCGPMLLAPTDQIDKRSVKPRGYGDDTRLLLEHVWMLMGMPCGKYFVVMRGSWLPLLEEAGYLDKAFATDVARQELDRVSAATVERYLRPARDQMRLKVISMTKASPRGCQELRVRWLVQGVGDAAWVCDGERIECLFPALGVAAELASSVVADVVDGQVEDFQHGVVGGERAAGFGCRSCRARRKR